LSTTIKHIAVIRLSAMGDVAMTVPVISAFVKQNPGIKITFISRLFFKPFFDEIPNVTFFAFDENKRHKGFSGILKLFFDLKKLKIDAFADLHNVIRTKAIRKLFALSGKKIAITNKGRDEKKQLTLLENKTIHQLPTMFENHVEVFRNLGFKIDVSNPVFSKKATLSQTILDLIAYKNQRLIGIAPFAQYETKVYPLDLMQKVIDELASNPENKIILFGAGKSESTKLDNFAKNHKNVINFAGKIEFREELKLISNLDLMLSMDSGNAHIAALFGVKTITLWGATHPFAGFAPYNQPLDNTIVSDREKFPFLPTSVYGNKTVAGYENAMRTILPETVIDKVNSVLG
jgi:ADP-heptose:LPS heptosyltransferase